MKNLLKKHWKLAASCPVALASAFVLSSVNTTTTDVAVGLLGLYAIGSLSVLEVILTLSPINTPKSPINTPNPC